ncbi:MAG: MauE/DoxX family redox-associated membrane protein [Cytophagales bacterium]|nr:MauE/DoxX family redox-associated membrane protein [Cytophagales bacterium]
MARKITVDIVVFLCILLLVYAAVSKLLDYEKFTVQLGQSPMLTKYAEIFVWFVPLVELIISALLIIPKARIIGLYAAFSLMTMFTTYIILSSRFNDYVPCSCGGVIQNMSWEQHLLFNAAFLFLILIGILYV